MAGLPLPPLSGPPRHVGPNPGMTIWRESQLNRPSPPIAPSPDPVVGPAARVEAKRPPTLSPPPPPALGRTNFVPPRVTADTTNRVEAQQRTDGERVSDYILSPEGNTGDVIQDWSERKNKLNDQDIFLLWKEVGTILENFQYPLNKSPVDAELRGLALLYRSLIAEEAGARGLELPGLGTDDTLAITGPEPAPPAAPPTSFAIKPLPPNLTNPSNARALATGPALAPPSSSASVPALSRERGARNSVSTETNKAAPATLGVSQSNINNVKLGGLQNYMDFAKQLMPAREKRDPWLTAFEFFVNMAAESSKPGATAIGAAGTAGQQVMKTLAEDRRLERAEDLAATKMGITLAATLSKDKPSKPYVDKETNKIKYFTVSQFNSLGNKENYIPYKAPGGGSEKERYTSTVIDIGPKITAGTASDDEIAKYSIAYQQLTKGYTTTTFDDEGNQQEIRVAGIDLTNLGSNVPLPEGFDAKKVLSSKSREWGALGTNANFAQRMLFQEGVVRGVLADGYRPNIRDTTADEMPAFIGTTAMSPEGRRFMTASRNFIAAVLRKESGAAISDGEYLNGLRQYFPRVGDDAEVIQDKEALRSAAITGMVNESGDAFEAIYPQAMPFLKIKVGETEHDIINPRGYSVFETAKVKQGRSLYFTATIQELNIDELKAMLARPDAQKIYTDAQIREIGKRLDELKKGVN
jgi:hypothetical protein